MTSQTTNNNEQDKHHEQHRHPNNDPSLHPSTPKGHVYVKPRIKAIERRMQLRTPEPTKNNNNDHPPSAPPNGNNENNNSNNNSNNNNITKNLTSPMAKFNNTTPTTKNNHALVLRSPSILPNSTIKQFESDLLKKQAQYSARISDLDGRLAAFHTRLAVECAERGREHAFTMEEYVDGPMERTMMRSLGRIENEFVRPIMDPKRATAILAGGSATEEDDSGEKQSSSVDKDYGITDNEMVQEEEPKNNNNNQNSLPNLVVIERRTNLLEAQMNHHQHVTLFHSRRRNFDDVDKTCRKTLQPALSLEMTKADKREGGMVRRFESSSGEYARLASEMTCTRVSALGYVEKEINDWDSSDLTRAEHYLEEIERLKEMVRVESAERARRDKAVVATIVQRQKMWEEDIYLTC